MAVLLPMTAFASPIGELTTVDCSKRWAPVKSVESKLTGRTESYKVAARADVPEVSVITEAPADGVREVFRRSGDAWWIRLINAERDSFDYFGMELVTMPDGTVYMRNPSSHYVSDSYIVGYKEGDKMSFTLPQPIESDVNFANEPYVYYAVLLDYKATTSTQGTYIPSEKTELTFSKTADGGWKMDLPSDGSVLFGMISHDNEWFGYGDWNITLTPFKDEPLKAPESLKTEKWAMKYTGEGHMVDVGIDGDDFWIKGICPAIPDAWVKGTINGRRVTFDGGQYMGMDNVDYKHNYFFGATRSMGTLPNGKEGYVYVLNDKLRCDWNPDKKSLTYEQYFDVNAHPEKEMSHELYLAPKVEWQPEQLLYTPARIQVNDFALMIPEFGDGGIDFDLTKYNIDGALLNSDNIYYRILVDDDYFEIDPEMYTKVEELMTDIPFYFIDYDRIFGRVVHHEFYFPIQGFDYMGIRAVYKDGEHTYFGPITDCYGSIPEEWDGRDEVYYTLEEVPWLKPGSVSDVESSEVVAEFYTDLMGVRVANPEKGIYIRTVKYADGRVRSTKVVK